MPKHCMLPQEPGFQDFNEWTRMSAARFWTYTRKAVLRQEQIATINVQNILS